MPNQKGTALVVRRGNGDGPPETFTKIAGLTSDDVDFGTDDIDVTTKDDVDPNGVTWPNTLGGRAQFSASGSGVARDEAALKTMIADSLAGTIRNYEVELLSIGVVAGPMKLNLSFSGQENGRLEFNYELRSAGIQTWTAAS